MEKVTFDDLLKYAKRTIREMHDEFGNIKEEYQILINKINNHPEYQEIIIRLQEAKSREQIEILEEGFNEMNAMILSNNIPQYNTGISYVEPEAVQIYQEGIINPFEQEFDSTSNSNQMENPKVYVKSNGHSLNVDERQAGYINLLLLTLATGFSGGIITAIMIGIIK